MHRRTLAFLALSIAACGAPPTPKPPPKATMASVKAEPTVDKSPKTAVVRRAPDKGPNGETVSIEDGSIQIKFASGEERTLEASEIHPPPGERSLLAILATAFLYLDDGTLLVGAADGTVTALDGSLHRKWSIGFRGAISDVVPTEDGLVVVTTQSGVVALMTSEGKLRWERQITADALTPAQIGPGGNFLVAGPRGVLAFSSAGNLVFSHAASLGEGICCLTDSKDAFSVDASGRVTAKGLDFRFEDPHPAIPSLEPSFPLHYENVFKGDIVSLLATGPSELLALVEKGRHTFEVVRIEGDKTRRIPVPERSTRSEIFDEEEQKPERPRLAIDALVMGPNGNPWLLARRVPGYAETVPYYMPVAAKGQILELQGNTIRERNDLVKVFDEHPVTSSPDTQILAAPDGTANLFCFCEEKPACVLYEGGTHRLLTAPDEVTSVSRIGSTDWITTESKGVFRLEGQEFTPVTSPAEAVNGFDAIGGISERDRWSSSRYGSLVFHSDGAKWTPIATPFPVSGIVARTPTDAWSRDGRLHWDGNRWSVVYGAPSGRTIVVRGPNDVWVGGEGGLWHGTAPGLSTVRLPEPAQPDGGALAAPTPLHLGKPLTGYFAGRISIAVKGEESITTAKRVAAGPDGLLWVESWDRLVEVDAEGKGTVLESDEKRILVDRWFHPEGPGRGILLHRERQSESHNERDTIWRLEGGKTTPAGVQLEKSDVVAVNGNGSGTAWIVGTFGSGTPYHAQRMNAYEFVPHALVRDGDNGRFQPVFGLPSASFVDVAVTPDGGAWFAGALNSGPMGEGILFRARGKLGGEATTRLRAPATLLAVASFGNDEAWAVGASGIIVRVVGNAVTRYALGSGEWLRAVAGTGPTDVWIGGDGGTLIHYDGKEFRPVEHPLGARAAFTGIAISRGAVWAVSPSGIVQSAKR